ncbi:MAG: hypothetical protein U1F54_05775 [Burkholderiales bacterium]
MNIDFNEERPDVRFWTDYDHFMVMREARAMRRQYVRGLVIDYAARFANALKSTGARPVTAAKAAG